MTYKFDVLGEIELKIRNKQAIEDFINKIKSVSCDISFDSNIDKIKDEFDDIRDKAIKITTNFDDTSVKKLDDMKANVKLNVDDSEINKIESKLKHLSADVKVDAKIDFKKSLKALTVRLRNVDIAKATIADAIIDNVVGGIIDQADNWQELFRRLDMLYADTKTRDAIVKAINDLHLDLSDANQLLQYMTPRVVEDLGQLLENGTISQQQLEELIALGYKAESIQQGGFDDVVRGLQALPPELRDSKDDIVAYMNIINENLKMGNTEVAEQIRNLAPVFGENTLKICSLLAKISTGTDTANQYANQLLKLYEESGRDWDKFLENLHKLVEGKEVEGIDPDDFKELIDAIKSNKIDIDKAIQLNYDETPLEQNTDALKDNTDAIKQLTDKIQQLIYDLGGKNALNNITPIAALITGAISALVGGLSFLSNILSTLKLQESVLLEHHKNILADIKDEIDRFNDLIDANRLVYRENIRDLKITLQELNEAIYTKNFDKIFEKIEKMKQTYLVDDKDIERFKKLVDEYKKVSDELEKTKSSFHSLYGAFDKQVSVIKSFTQIFTKITDSFKEIGEGISKKLNIGKFIEKIKSILPTLKKLKDIFKGGDRGTLYFGINPDTVKNISKIAQAFSKLKPILSNLKPILKALGRAFAVLGVVINPLMELLQGDIPGAITHLKVELVELVAWPVALGEMLAALTLAVGDFLGIFNLDGDSPLAAARAGILTLLAAFESIYAFITGDWSSVKEDLKQAFEELGSSEEEAAQLAQNIVDSWKQLPQQIMDALNSLGEDLANTFDEAWTTISDWWDNKIEEAKEWGSDLIQNIIDGINEMIPSLSDVVNEAAEVIHKVLHHTTPDEGPLKDDDKWGIHFMENIIGGIESKIPHLEQAVNKTASTMSVQPQPSQTSYTYGDIHINVIGNGFNENQLAQKIALILKRQQFR